MSRNHFLVDFIPTVSFSDCSLNSVRDSVWRGASSILTLQLKAIKDNKDKLLLHDLVRDRLDNSGIQPSLGISYALDNVSIRSCILTLISVSASDDHFHFPLMCQN